MRTIATAITLTALLTLGTACQSDETNNDAKPAASASPTVDREANKKEVCAAVQTAITDFQEEFAAAAGEIGKAMASGDEAAITKVQQEMVASFKNFAADLREQQSKAVDPELKSQLDAAATGLENGADEMAKGEDSTDAEDKKFEDAIDELEKTCKA